MLGTVARQYLTTREAADQIGVAASTLQAWAAKGRVTPKWRTPGGQARWDLADLKRQLGMPPNGKPGDRAETGLPRIPPIGPDRKARARRPKRRLNGVLPGVL
jgi:excisionase family DNA binding protein